MDEIVFSIVIPIYNASKYIEHCIDSLLSQNYRLFELILVDDGSQDDSLAKCKKYAALDNRVIVYHKDNGGPSSARNFGLKEAKGNYILFIDSDDYVESNYLSMIYDMTQSNDADLYVLGFIVDYSNRAEIFKLNDHFYSKSKICDFIESELKSRHWGNPWNKVYKKEIVENNNILFDETINYSEDALFNFCYANYCKSVYSSSITSYHYRNFENQGSLSKRVLPFQENQYILNKLLQEGLKLSSNRKWYNTLDSYLLNEMTLWLLKCPKDDSMRQNIVYYLDNIPKGKFPIYVLPRFKSLVFRTIVKIKSPKILNYILKHR